MTAVGIGTGIGIGLGGQTIKPIAKLASAIQSALGSLLLGQWTADDAVVASGGVDSLPARTGGATLVNLTAAKFGVATINGRQFIDGSANDTAKSLASGDFVADTNYIRGLFVAAKLPAIPTAGYQTVADICYGTAAGGTANCQLIDATKTVWYDTANTRYVDSSTTESDTMYGEALHVYYVRRAVEANYLGVRLGGTYNGTAVHRGQVGTLIAVTGTPTEAQRLAVVAALKFYYGITT